MELADKITLFAHTFPHANSTKDAALVAGIDPTYAYALVKALGLTPKPRGNGAGRYTATPSAATLDGIAALRSVAEKHNLPTRTVAGRVASHFNNIAARAKKEASKAIVVPVPNGEM